MALKLKYQGKEYERNKNQKRYRESYYGTETEVDTLFASLTIGTYVDGKGYLESFTKSQDEGAFWKAEVEYTVEYESTFNNTESTVVGKKSATLSVRNIQMPLESHTNYKTCWNYYLIGLDNAALPSWSLTATDTILSVTDRKEYMWVKSVGEVPTDPNADGKYWTILQEPTKPGVENYDLACFVVQERAKYGSASAAGSAVSKNINTITSPSETFGISGGNWKLDEGNVSYDGKNWIASCTYTRSGDTSGWDQDLYG